jgi:predicted nucleic acid-binding protein
MAGFFFDSSAVVKRYLKEPGSARVVSLAAPTPGNQSYLVSITGVEVVSASRRKTLSGGLTGADATIAIGQCKHDFIIEYQIVQITSALITRAMKLADKHALRGYDAVQLAAALDVHDNWMALGMSALTVISADASLNAAAITEGLTVADPNAHP